jgi:hypothetical protein
MQNKIFGNIKTRLKTIIGDILEQDFISDLLRICIPY